MSKKLIASLAIVAVVVAAIVYIALRPSANEPAMKNEPTQTQPAVEAPQAATPVIAPGAYVDYAVDEIKKAAGTKILFFHAPWCPQCRQLDASIKNGHIPNNVIIFKVDYDTNQALRKQYGVALQTTLIKLDDNGQAVAKFVAYDDPTLESVIKNLLQ